MGGEVVDQRKQVPSEVQETSNAGQTGFLDRVKYTRDTYEKQVAENDNEIPISEAHRALKEYSGKNYIKLSKLDGDWKGFDWELAAFVSLVSGKKVESEPGFQGPGPDFKAEIRSQYDKGLAGVIKTGVFNFISGNTDSILEGPFGKLNVAFQAYYEAPEVSLSSKKKKGKFGAVEVTVTGRWELISGVTLDLYGEFSLWPKTEQVLKGLKNLGKKAQDALKVRKGKALQKVMVEALKAERAEVLEQIAKLGAKQDDDILRYINKAIQEGDAKILKRLGFSNNKIKRLLSEGAGESLEQLARTGGTNIDKLRNTKLIKNDLLKKYIKEAIKDQSADALRKLKGVGRKTAQKLLRLDANTLHSLDDLKGKGIDKKLLKQIKSSNLHKKAIQELKEQSVKLTDDIAKTASKSALKVFEQNTKNAGKKTVRKVAVEVAEKLGLKVGAKFLGRLLLKFIPFVNVGIMAWDLYEIGSLLYKAYKAYDNPKREGTGGGGGDESGETDRETGSAQESAGKAPENTIAEREAPLPAGISETARQVLEQAPLPIQKMWHYLTLQEENTITNEHLMHFLSLVPENISDERADEIILRMLEDPAPDPEALLEKLRITIANLPKESVNNGGKAPGVSELPEGKKKKEDSNTDDGVKVTPLSPSETIKKTKEYYVKILNPSGGHINKKPVTLDIDFYYEENKSVRLKVPAKVIDYDLQNANGKSLPKRQMKRARFLELIYQLLEGFKLEVPGREPIKIPFKETMRVKISRDKV